MTDADTAIAANEPPSSAAGIVVGEGGWQGRVSPAAAGAGGDGTPRVVIRPDDGGPSLTIPAALLLPQSDGSFRLPLVRSAVAAYAMEAGTVPHASAIASGERIVIPLIEEMVEIRKQWVDTGGGVRVTKTVSERQETVNEPLHRESVSVTRVPVNRIVDAPYGPHEEGETLIVPLFEETLVVEKRIVLREELRITRQRTVDRYEQRTVPVLREEAVIERFSPAEERRQPAATAPDDIARPIARKDEDSS